MALKTRMKSSLECLGSLGTWLLKGWSMHFVGFSSHRADDWIDDVQKTWFDPEIYKPWISQIYIGL